MNVYDIFDREPTDPEWSSQMQARIEKQLGEDIKILAPSAKNVAVVCHWATCKISAEVGQSDASRARAALTVAQFGDRTSFSKKSHELTRDGVVKESAIVLFHAERDLDVQAASYQKKRDAFMLHMPPNDPLYGPVVRHNLSK
ncbi:hypothetical protein [Sorangium sp. So ce341]|uniref:hypothetical protein n=1 Tax=Sorangium sp. So ce341 TaxID=3133302 RepID=UPI003F5EA265